MILIAGPCVIESKQLCIDIAGYMKEIAENHDLEYYFKASFDKANRTSGNSFRGLGIDEGLEILDETARQTGCKLLTDIHESWQAKIVGEVVDAIQIPAFLCRQTDLIYDAAANCDVVNIKKGQFMAPEQMEVAVEKAFGAEVWLTERGTCFGYGDLVVDFRSIPIMRKFAKVIFDCTHSVQKPGTSQSGGSREFVPYLMSAANAVGVDGFFMEVHPNPEKALSDSATCYPLDRVEDLLERL